MGKGKQQCWWSEEKRWRGRDGGHSPYFLLLHSHHRHGQNPRRHHHLPPPPSSSSSSPSSTTIVVSTPINPQIQQIEMDDDFAAAAAVDPNILNTLGKDFLSVISHISICMLLVVLLVISLSSPSSISTIIVSTATLVYSKSPSTPPPRSSPAPSSSPSSPSSSSFSLLRALSIPLDETQLHLRLLPLSHPLSSSAKTPPSTPCPLPLSPSMPTSSNPSPRTTTITSLYVDLIKLASCRIGEGSPERIFGPREAGEKPDGGGEWGWHRSIAVRSSSGRTNRSGGCGCRNWGSPELRVSEAEKALVVVGGIGGLRSEEEEEAAAAMTTVGGGDDDDVETSSSLPSSRVSLLFLLPSF